MSLCFTSRASSVVFALAASSVVSSVANAQWTAVNLLPESASRASILGGRPGQQVGTATFLSSMDIEHAALWSGTAASCVDLHPPGSALSGAYATDGTQQAGAAWSFDLGPRACLWSGSAASYVDLHPSGTWQSIAFDVDNGQQVGQVLIEENGLAHAALWYGTAASWVNLNPSASSRSEAYGVHSGRQVGYVVTSEAQAAMWSGTAESFVSLHPAGAIYSLAHGIHGDQQVGYYAQFSGPSFRACLWQSTAASWVDLHPAGATRSEAVATDGEWQVGYFEDPGLAGSRACVWHGTRDSLVDLGEFLPPGYTFSYAQDVWSDAGVLYVVGRAFSLTLPEIPVIWSRPLGPQDRCIEAVRTDLWTETDGAAGDALGTAAAISGDTAVLGVPGDDTAAGVNAGSVYVYRNVDGLWTLEARLTATQAAGGDEFGAAVAIEGDTIVVGAPRSNSGFSNDTGAVYVFTRQPGSITWTQQARLVAADRAPDDYLGSSVSYSGSRIVAGAPGDGSIVGMSDIGAAYVFVRTGETWSEEDKITASDGASEDEFGVAASIFGDTLVVGAVGEESGGGNTDRGAAYVFIRSGSAWAQQGKLTAADGAGGDAFGFSVAAAQDRVIVGANGANLPGALNTGAAYVFVRSGVTWSQQAKLTAQDAEESDFFGSSVSLADSRAVVGAAGADTVDGSGAGAAYVFARSGTDWTQEQKVVAADGAAGDGFGNAVALTSTTVLVGASGDDTPDGLNAGSGHVFTLSDGTWSQQAKLVASDGSSADGATPFGFGGDVVISGDWAVVGVPSRATSAGEYVGAAYVYERSVDGLWIHHSTLVASDGAAEDRFGAAIAISGKTVVVGSPFASTAQAANAGAAYVFHRSSNGVWTERQKLAAFDGAAADYFGRFVAVSGDAIAVSSTQDDLGAQSTDEGSVYLFERSGNNWSLESKVRASDLEVAQQFGLHVALSDDTLAASMVGNPGSVLVFRRSPIGDGWTQEAQLFPPPSIGTSRFGSSLDIDGNRIVVGAGFAQPAGVVIEYTRTGTTWALQQVIVSPTQSAAFGLTCSLDSGLLVVGDDAGTQEVQQTGAAYLFTRSESNGQWIERAVLAIPAAAPLDRFGYSVDISGDHVLVSSPSDDTPGGTEAGSVHVYRLDSSYSPAITTHPVSAAACISGQTAFSVAAAGTPPLSYQWQLETVPGSDVWINVTNGVMPGIGTFDISIPEVMVASAISGGLSLTTRCVVTNDCGSTTSEEAALTVCAADFDCDGIRAVPDIFAFLSAWFAGNPAADIDGSPGLGVPDIFFFLSLWFAGCD